MGLFMFYYLILPGSPRLILDILLLMFRILPEVSLRWGVHLLLMTLPLRVKDLPWDVDQVCINTLIFFWQCSGQVIRFDIA